MDSSTRRTLLVVGVAIVVIILIIIAIISGSNRSSSEASKNDDTNENAQVESSQTGTIIATDEEGEWPVQVYFIVPGIGSSGNDIGCNDGIRSTIHNTPSKELVKEALNTLFSVKQQTTDNGDYYNALWQSNLSVKNVEFVQDKAIIKLEGQTVFNDDCDAPRALAQIEQTAKTAISQQTGSLPSEIDIFLNDQTLNEALGLR